MSRYRGSNLGPPRFPWQGYAGLREKSVDMGGWPSPRLWGKCSNSFAAHLWRCWDFWTCSIFRSLTLYKSTLFNYSWKVVESMFQDANQLGHLFPPSHIKWLVTSSMKTPMFATQNQVETMETASPHAWDGHVQSLRGVEGLSLEEVEVVPRRNWDFLVRELGI